MPRRLKRELNVKNQIKKETNQPVPFSKTEMLFLLLSIERIIFLESEDNYAMTAKTRTECKESNKKENSSTQPFVLASAKVFCYVILKLTN